jgi:hypothetical protein
MTTEMTRPEHDRSLTRPGGPLPFAALAAEPPEVSVAYEREVVEHLDDQGQLER